MKYYLLKKKLFRCIMKITIPAMRSRLWETLNLSKCADSRGQKNQHYWSKKRRRKNVLPITWHISPVSYTNNHHRLSPANFCTMHGRLFFCIYSNSQNGSQIAILATRSQSTVHAVPVAAGGDKDDKQTQQLVALITFLY